MGCHQSHDSEGQNIEVTSKNSSSFYGVNNYRSKLTTINLLKFKRKKKNSNRTSNSSSSVDKAADLYQEAAVKAASTEILTSIHSSGHISVDTIYEQFSKYERVCNLVQKYFPGAQDSSTIVSEVKSVLMKDNFVPSNTLFGQSICPDEINHTVGEITNLFTQYFGTVFHLGGLAGIPFTGKTGFRAFANHAPKNGKLFILLAPHIGLSERSQLGQFTRKGQHHDGSACGAAVGAFRHCMECKTIPTRQDLGENAEDYQMSYIIHRLNSRMDSLRQLTDENDKMASLAQNMYEIARDMLNDIVTYDFGNEVSTIVVLAGIQINMPLPLADFFQPLLFESRSCKIGDTVPTVVNYLNIFSKLSTKASTLPS